MREPLDKLLDKMGVSQTLGPYQTCPWSAYDSTRGVTCNAEIRMDSDGAELEAEVQLLFDAPQDGKMMQQVMSLRCRKDQTQNWTAEDARLKGQDAKSIYAWEEKACEFVKAVSLALRRDEVPNIDDLVDEIFYRNERFSDQYGGGTSKAPKIRPQQLLDMKQGRGF
ncbi:MAG: hypothetical protein V4621_01585 [Pseudomonadota bacterium]